MQPQPVPFVWVPVAQGSVPPPTHRERAARAPPDTCFTSALCHWPLDSEGPSLPPAPWMRTTAAGPGESPVCPGLGQGALSSPYTSLCEHHVRIATAWGPWCRVRVLSCVRAWQTGLVLFHACWETTCDSQGLCPSRPST